MCQNNVWQNWNWTLSVMWFVQCHEKVGFSPQCTSPHTTHADPCIAVMTQSCRPHCPAPILLLLCNNNFCQTFFCLTYKLSQIGGCMKNKLFFDRNLLSNLLVVSRLHHSSYSGWMSMEKLKFMPWSWVTKLRVKQNKEQLTTN